MGWKSKEDRRVYNKIYHLENKEKIASINKIWRANNKEKHNASNRESYKRCKESKREYQLKNKEKIAQYHKEYNKANYAENKDKYKETTDIWIQNNLDRLAAKTARRRATKLQQTPKWADLKAIEEFYKNCPEGYEVDHIIPLKGENVRGLHVLENLQYLTVSENRRKGNRYGSF